MKQPLWIPFGILNFLLEYSADYVYYDEANDYVAFVDKDMNDITFVVQNGAPIRLDMVVGISLSAVIKNDPKVRKGVLVDVASMYRDAMKHSTEHSTEHPSVVETLKYETTKHMENHVKRIVGSFDECHDLTPCLCTSRFASFFDLIEQYNPTSVRVAFPNTRYPWFVVRATFGDTTLYHLSFPRNYEHDKERSD